MNSYLLKAINEFVGTFVFILVGMASCTPTSLIHPVVGFPFALLAALLFFTGDFNPSISLSKLIFGDYNIQTMIFSIMAQIIGGLLAFLVIRQQI